MIHSWRSLCWVLLWYVAGCCVKGGREEGVIETTADVHFDHSLPSTDEGSSCVRRRLEDLTESSPSYYSVLRNDSNTQVLSTSNNIYQVSDSNTGQIYRLAELKAYIPFTENGDTFRGGSCTESFAALLAVYHFNNVDLSPILNSSDVEMCRDLKFTMTLLDSQFNAIETTRLFTQMLKSSRSLASPFATGMVGAYRSAVSLPLAILSGVNGIPQISPASSAIDFDDKDQYPLFGRTVCNSVGEAQVAVDFFKTIGSTHVVVLYVTDTYGSALQKAFQDGASKANIVTDQVAVSYYVTGGSTELRSAIASLKQRQYRHIYAVCFQRQLKPIMEEALSQGVVGPDYLWVFPALTRDDFYSLGDIPSGSPLANAFKGIGLINPVGSVGDTGILAGLSGNEEFMSSFARFNASWQEAFSNSDFVEYATNALPGQLSELEGYNASSPFDEGGAYSLLLYDAVTAIALAMCNAGNDFFNGSQVFDAFRHQEFYGASGLVQVDNVTGTRFYNTLRWAVWNSQFNESSDGGNTVFNFTPALHFTSNSSWQAVPESPFVYASGSTTAPSSLPPPDIQQNYIGTTGRVVGYLLMSITLISSILSVAWLFYYRHEYVVVSAQPLFLLMVSVGSCIMALTILPLGFEETVVNSKEALDKACMSVPWLYILGSAFPLSAMTAKVRGVHKAYVDPEIEFIQVTDFDLLSAFGALFLVNLIILTCWTTVSPLEWDRQFSGAVDEFGRQVETYATCGGDNAVLFWSILAVVNLSVLVLCNWWAYRSRNIETEFNESSYVGVSAAAVLQAWCMGIPIIIVVVSDSPPATFYVATGIVFVTSQAVLSLIYVPKVLALRKLKKEELSKKKTESYHNYLERSKSKSGSQFAKEEDENPAPDADGVGSFTKGRDPDDMGSFTIGRDRLHTAPLTGISVVSEELAENPQEPLDPLASTPMTNGAHIHSEPVEDSQHSESNNAADARESKSESFALGGRTQPTDAKPQSVSWSPATGQAAAAEFQRQEQQVQASPTQPVSPTRPDDRGGLLKRKSSPRRKFSVFPAGGSSRSMEQQLPEGGPCGPKILHNPRAKRNLAVSGGYELSRQQMELLQEMEEKFGVAPNLSGEVDSGLPVLPTSVVPPNGSMSSPVLPPVVMEVPEEGEEVDPGDEEQANHQNGAREGVE